MTRAFFVFTSDTAHHTGKEEIVLAVHGPLRKSGGAARVRDRRRREGIDLHIEAALARAWVDRFGPGVRSSVRLDTDRVLERRELTAIDERPDLLDHLRLTEEDSCSRIAKDVCALAIG